VTAGNYLGKVVPQLQITKSFFQTLESKQQQQQDSWGNTPMHYAALFGQLQCIRVLLEKGHKVDQKNNKGETPLFLACSQPSGFHQACADLLIRVGSKVNAKNILKETPLVYAVRRGRNSSGKSSNHNIIQFLVTWNADTNMKDTDGRTVLT
jgi:ankyrin repeat protein